MCPMLDESNPSCASHLTLDNILTAFAHCADRYGECPVYQHLIARLGSYESDAKRNTMLVAS